MTTYARLREVLHYEPETGHFRWIKMLASRGPVGAITAAKRTHHLGYFETPEEAHAAYAAKARELFGSFMRAS